MRSRGGGIPALSPVWTRQKDRNEHPTPGAWVGLREVLPYWRLGDLGCNRYNRSNRFYGGDGFCGCGLNMCGVRLLHFFKDLG